MRAKHKYTLQRTMILYFLLIGFASCMVGIEFMFDFNTGRIESKSTQSTIQHGQDSNDVAASFDRMRKKALVMVAIILVVTIIVMTMFIKNISEPLQHMINLAHEISSGDLSRTITIQSDNELSELGNIINEMSSNLQEILLLTRGICAEGQGLVDDAAEQLKSGPLDSDGQTKIEDIIQRLGGEFASLNEMAVFFNYYRGDIRNDVG